MPPTRTDSSVFIWILRDIYGHTDTTRHYTEARFRPQAQDMQHIVSRSHTLMIAREAVATRDWICCW